MSLFFDLRVTDGPNPSSLGLVEIQRITNVTDAQPGPNTVSMYKVLVGGVRFGHVQHRYGDGPWRLVALAAECVKEVQGRMERPR